MIFLKAIEKTNSFNKICPIRIFRIRITSNNKHFEKHAITSGCDGISQRRL